jgi:hypothetical protein
MATIKEILMRRDGLTEKQAETEIQDAKELLQEYLAEGDMEAAGDICQDCFGLEPDYIFELMD